MSKLMIFCVIFVVIVGGLTAIFFISVPKSLQIMKTEIIETGQKNGFLVEIRKSKIIFPSTIELGDIQISDFSQNFCVRINSAGSDISFLGYMKAIFGRITGGERILLQSFSQKAVLQGIDLIVAEKHIFTGAQGNLFFEHDGAKFEITAENIENIGIEIQNFSASGKLIDSALVRINSNTGMFGGEIGVNGNLNLNDFTLKNSEIEIRGIEIGNLLPDFNISGALSAKITPNAEELVLSADFLQNIRNLEASGLVSISNFSDSGNKFSKQILSALAFVGIKSLDFAKISADIEYSPAKIVVNNFIANNYRFAILADGHFIPKDFEYKFSAGIRFTPAARSTMDRAIWETMTPDIPRNEGRFLGANISGRGESISVSFDEQTFKRGINTLLSSIRDIFR